MLLLGEAQLLFALDLESGRLLALLLAVLLGAFAAGLLALRLFFLFYWELSPCLSAYHGQ